MPDLMPAVRAAALADREVLEKGIRAFVSYVRGYKEHHCKYIFRLQDLDLGKLAYACALLQLPRMPEIRRLGGKAQGFTPADGNPNTVKVHAATLHFTEIVLSSTYTETMHEGYTMNKLSHHTSLADSISKHALARELNSLLCIVAVSGQKSTESKGAQA